MTLKQKKQFNQMLFTLRKISKVYMTPEQIKKDKTVGLDYDEYLEYAYENIQSEAKAACRHVREIKHD